MEDHLLNFYSIMKVEPLDFISGDTVNWNTTGARLDLNNACSFCATDPGVMEMSATVKIEDMELIDLKIEENLDEKGIVLEKDEEAQPLTPGILTRKNVKKVSQSWNLMKIARDYVNLHSDEVWLPSPIPKFLGSTIIQCLACMGPRKMSRSSFLELLQHVTRRHSESCGFLFTVISKRYAPLIKHMKRKILNRADKMYSERLRSIGLRRGLSED